MLPHFNPHLHNPNNQLQLNGANASAPHQLSLPLRLPLSDAGVVNDVSDRKNNWRKPHDKNFTGNHKHNEAQRGCDIFQFNNEIRGKGNKNFAGKNFNLSNPSEQIQVGKKRSLMLNYTEQESQHWREERKKNYPSQANVEKKLKKNPKQLEVEDEAAKIRRQQIKEILAKQAELGCEVAEIPSCYLSDPEQQADAIKQNKRAFGKRDRFHNKFDKKGKFQQSDRYSKKQRYEIRRFAKPNWVHDQPS
ncbi:hypothetical protein AAHA92_09274 [Salvia divinorum]|uniref:FMR1-interacting protein 1 conserved domain-containing protein n=1 Tax=Salvia divinorum TaxID=28513 RepID=A0ABD1HQV8_SALDI